MNIILFNEEEVLKPLSCKDARAVHIKKVLHKNIGETFDAGIINGKAGIAVIDSITDTEIKFSFKPTHESKKMYPLVLIVGFPRPIQLKRLLRDVSSLGVCQIHLTGTELGEKSYLKSTLLEKGAAYEGLLDGAIQAKTTFVPELYMHNSLKECIYSISNMRNDIFKNQQNIEKILLDNVKPKYKLSDMTITHSFENKTVFAAIGSERGWTDKERDLLLNNSYISCSLGERILRTETASVTAVSLILAGMNVI